MRIFISNSDKNFAFRAVLNVIGTHYQITDIEYKSNFEIYQAIGQIQPNDFWIE